MPAKKKKPGRRKKKELSIEVPSSLYQYNRGDIVLCYHGPHLYKAKILKRTIANSQINSNNDNNNNNNNCNNNSGSFPMYFVHYHGWNRQWDEWVDSKRMLPENDQNNELMNQLNNKQKNNKNNKNIKKNKKKNKIKKRIRKNKKKTRIIKDSEESNSETETETENETENENQIQTENNQIKTDNKEEESENNDNDDDNDNDNDDDIYLQQLKRKKKKLKQKDLDNIALNREIETLKSKLKPVSITDNDNDVDNVDDVDNAARFRFKDKLKSIILPTSLRDNLVQQWQLIHYSEKLIAIPKAYGFTINDILYDAEQNIFSKISQNKKGDLDLDDRKIIELLPIIINGIKGFFKNSIRVNLLYNFEKPQLYKLNNNNNNNIDLCGIYGCEHLIRLFYILPNILFHTIGINDNNFAEIKQCITILIQYLAKNKDKYLCDYNDLLADDNNNNNNNDINIYAQNDNLNQKRINIKDYVQDVDDDYLAKVKQIQKKYTKAT